MGFRLPAQAVRVKKRTIQPERLYFPAVLWYILIKLTENRR